MWRACDGTCAGVLGPAAWAGLGLDKVAVLTNNLWEGAAGAKKLTARYRGRPQRYSKAPLSTLTNIPHQEL